MADLAADLLTVVRAQRACRDYDAATDVPDADVETLLDAAVHAPSAENTQPWEFVVVRGPETREALSATMQAAWAAGGSEYVRSRADDRLFADIDRGITGGFLSAPVMIVICADLTRVEEMWAASSIYPAAQNILLAAGALGYGSCLTTGLTTVFAQQVREHLGLPDTSLPLAAIYVGRPARSLGPPRREPASRHTHRERYGQPW
jgi:nitroreductase